MNTLVVLKYSRSFPCAHFRKLPTLVTFRNVKTVWTYKLCDGIGSFRPKVGSPDSSSTRQSRFARSVFVVL